MSLEIDLAVLAEGATADARGSMTLVAANINVFVAEELPTQFAPVFMVVVKDEDGAADKVLNPGAIVDIRVEVQAPDGQTLFVSQMRQMMQPPPYPDLFPRLQLVAQVPFTASKVGPHRISADVTVTDGIHESAKIAASRTAHVVDRTSLRTEKAT